MMLRGYPSGENNVYAWRTFSHFVLAEKCSTKASSSGCVLLMWPRGKYKDTNWPTIGNCVSDGCASSFAPAPVCSGMVAEDTVLYNSSDSNSSAMAVS